MRNFMRRLRRLFTFRRVAVGAVLLLALSFVSWGRGPSLAEWAQAFIRGGGKLHFPISGTPESRLEDFLNRNPGLRPAWREVSPEKNGFLLLKKYVESDVACQLALTDELNKMLIKGNEWKEDVVRDYCEKNQKELNELRHIALLPERSAQGKSGGEFLDARLYKKMSDVLLLSFTHHLHSNELADAYTDFTALYGLAAHMDRHEVPNFLDKTVGILIRLAPQEALREFLKAAPADTDWSPWIRILDNEPSYTQQMEAMWRGEAWCGAHLIFALFMTENEINPIWDFTEFEDAYANWMLENAKAYANAEKIADLDLQNLEEEFSSRHASLGMAARGVMDVVQIGGSSWCQGAIRSESQFALTLAALQLLQSERSGGPIQSVDDPRVSQLAIDPSNEKPFVFNPLTRQLSAAEGSALQDVDPVQLPRQ